MATTTEWKIGGVDEDTWEHALIHCTMSRCIWAQLGEEIADMLATIFISDSMH
jgi:hypothetical protein